MSGYVEDNNNAIYQVLNEFAEFLNCIYYFHTIDEKDIKNRVLVSMRLHARTITEFFQNDRKNSDDLIYTDFFDTPHDLSISITSEMKQFLNKSTAHISRKRGNLTFDNKEFFDLLKRLVTSIEIFMDRCDDSLKSEYVNYYQVEEVEILKKLIRKGLGRHDG